MKDTDLIGTVITLNKLEKEIVSLTANCRTENNVVNNMGSRLNVDYDTDQAEILGVAGELAHAKMLNLFPDFSISLRSSVLKHDTWDMVLPNGLTVDVKTTQYYRGKLISPIHKNYSGDLFALWVLVKRNDWSTLEFRGYFEQEELHKKERIGVLPRQTTENYMAYQEELKELKDIKVTYETISQMDS